MSNIINKVGIAYLYRYSAINKLLMMLMVGDQFGIAASFMGRQINYFGSWHHHNYLR